MVKYVVRTGEHKVFGLVGGALRANVVIGDISYNAVQFYGSRHQLYNSAAVYVWNKANLVPLASEDKTQE